MNRLVYYAFFTACTLAGCKKATPESSMVTPTEKTDDIALAELGKLAFSNITTTGAMITGKVLNKGGALVTSRGICWNKDPNPTIDNNPMEATSSKGSGEFTVALTALAPSQTYYIRPYAKNKGGITYGEQQVLTTADIQSVTFGSNPIFIVGSSIAYYDVNIISSGGGAVTERGICWGLQEKPTVTDHKVMNGATGTGKFRIGMLNLTPSTNYHLRAYAINETGVSYGPDISFHTIAKGKVTYTFNKVDNPTAQQLAAYQRLQVALDSAVWYANNYTSATKHVYLNYDPGVPTADANNEGWMRFGASEGYQNIRTMLHEMNHTLGTGTTSWWSQAIINGKYSLANANNMLKMINSDESAVINGDSMHWWPYGLNQNSEVSSSWDYVYNCLIIEAMRKDGMTSHSGAY